MKDKNLEKKGEGHSPLSIVVSSKILATIASGCSPVHVQDPVLAM